MKKSLWILLVLIVLVVFAGSVMAQTSTATIRGKVTNERGDALANAEINAVGTQSGFVKTVNSRGDGTYSLPGLTPGEYQIVVAAPGYEPRNEMVTVLVGQSLEMNLRMTPTAVLSESITVVGNQAVETRTSEVATNVTRQQIENLPQNDRNFLNFANLAPGVTMSTNPESKKVSAGAQAADQINVFIDGVSYKNDILPGGLMGQEVSRGNPFPQNAVQEFRVLTQNYSAQYDHASSAVITAVTKSGGNQLDGSAFAFYQPKKWVASTPFGFAGSTLTTNPDYHRYQTGLSLGGPIIRDHLHYFGSIEVDDEHTTKAVVVGDPKYLDRFGQYQGIFGSPFRSNLAFGKLTLQPMKNQLLDLSGSYRKEKDIRDFGGVTSYQSANNIKNWTNDITLRHQWNSTNSLNQASVSSQTYGWGPRPVNPTLVGLNYFGVIRLGGSPTIQDFKQRRIELRDDYTFAGFSAAGTHTLQAGGNLDFLRYRATKFQCGNPEYRFRADISFDFPFEACYGAGNPTLSDTNREYGFYGQDAWVVNPHLDLNLGLRWDYESNMLNTNYVTPTAVVQALTGKVDSSYFTNGNQRKPYKAEWQPRLGLNYDLFADSKSVVFGGWGRYYDRLHYNATFDERYRLQFAVRTFEFSADGLPRNGAPTVKWDPSYLTAAGLQQLISQGTTGLPEVYLLNNNTKPQYADQWNLGFRQSLGTWVGSLSYNSVRSQDGFSWIWGAGHCCPQLAPNYSNILISDNSKRTWYNGVYLTLDRPFINGWGANVAVTHGKATQIGGTDNFALDCCYGAVSNFPQYITPDSQRDRIVGSGIFGLPLDVRFSTIVTLGSGRAYPVTDLSRGFGFPNERAFASTIYPKKSGGFADRSIDFRLQKDFRVIGRTSVGVIGDVFNAANFHNYGCLNTYNPPASVGLNPNFGQPGCVISLGRRYQVGLRVGI